MKKISFNSFLHLLYVFYNGANYTNLIVSKNFFLLKNGSSSQKIKLSDISSVNIYKKFIFSDIVISTFECNYKLINLLSINANGIKRFLDFCTNYKLLQNEFKLYDSISDGTQYVSQSLNHSVLSVINNSILFKFKNLPFNRDKSTECDKYLKLYKNYKNNPEKVRKLNNDKFIEIELEDYQEFFDNVESNPLTKTQRVSIITNEDNNLIVAGAGSGKTSVIVGKVLYLLKKQLATPNEILILAFNKKAQEEIEERLSDKLDIFPDVKTFHGLGNHILRQGKNQKSLSKIATDELAFKNSIKALIQNNLDNENFSNIMKTYFQEFFYPMPNITNFETEGDYYNYLESFEIRTLNGEKVKSLEECYIANFLYLNGINYEYEKPYPYDCNSKDFDLYKPDFYLNDYNVYIEHFAINRNGITPDFIPCKKYIEGITWKRKTHELHNTKLIETYSWENYEGALLKNLKDKLIKYKVSFNPIDKKNMFQKLNKSKHIDSFTEMISTFLNHFKSNQFNLKSLFEKVDIEKTAQNNNKNAFALLHHMRNYAFLNIFNVIYSQYEKLLKDNNENDFNDMILLATKFLELGFFKSQYKYILVDEFQDISQGRALLLKELTKNNNVKLFCVGDDWQSIYRFTGSDISLMTNFQQEFGFTKRIDLDMTFRFDNQINDVATKFITQNENQLKKEISTVKKSDLPSVLIYYKDNDDDAIKIVLQEIRNNLKANDKNKILILSRFNKLKDRDKISRESFRNKLDGYKQEFPDLEIEFSSAHGSKGLGFDYVIVIDMNRGAFPLEKIDDPILNLVMPKPEKYPNAEERRLFYVALTRAKEKVFLIPDAKPSSFIEELESGNYNIGTYGSSENTRKMKCPKCGTGLLIKSNSKKSFICSHINYCDFITPVCDNCQKGYIKYNEQTNRYECSNPRCHEIKTKCPSCENGYLVSRESKHGNFYGCSNYPKCTYTKNINKKKQYKS